LVPLVDLVALMACSNTADSVMDVMDEERTASGFPEAYRDNREHYMKLSVEV
jgi:hypothetical protein